MSDLSDLSDLSDNFGAPLYTPWVCLAQCGVALVSDLSDLSDLSDKMGASRYTPWVCSAAVWNGSGAELPRGYATVSFTAGVCEAV